MNRSAIEYFESKKVGNKNICQQVHADPDISFLMSVVPDMKKMNDNQRRRFKIEVLKAAGNILSEENGPALRSTSTMEPLTSIPSTYEHTNTGDSNVVVLQNAPGNSDLTNFGEFFRFT